MNPPPVSFKWFLRLLLLTILYLLFSFIVAAFDKRTLVVFCDVGQGDAAYIRIKNSFDIVVDAGPDKKVLDCLGKHMPFYDRKIEMAFLSHPQKDHYGGFVYILERYQIERFIMSPADNKNQTFNDLDRALQLEKAVVKPYYSGTRLKIGSETSLNFLWPDKEYIMRLIKSKTDVNNFSQIFILREGSTTVLFTGDATPEVLNILSEQSIPQVKILKVPHHGSKNGLNSKFLKLADPDISVISSGKNNSYGHPSFSIIEMLQASKTKIRRTDKEGDIVFRLQ